jgi:hypothetical protein
LPAQDVAEHGVVGGAYTQAPCASQSAAPQTAVLALHGAPQHRVPPCPVGLAPHKPLEHWLGSPLQSAPGAWPWTQVPVGPGFMQ